MKTTPISSAGTRDTMADSPGVSRLVLISGIVLGLLWTVIGYAIVGAVERQLDPQRQSAYHQPLVEETRQYWTGVFTVGGGIAIAFASILGLGGLAVGRQIVAVACIEMIAVSLFTFVDVTLPRLHLPSRASPSALVAWVVMWMQALVPLLMTSIYPLIACVAAWNDRRKIGFASGSDAQWQVKPPIDLLHISRGMAPMMAYRAPETRGPRSAWVPLARTAMLIGILLGILLTVPNIYRFRECTIETFVQRGRSSHHIGGIPVSNAANWAFEGANVVGAVALIAGGVLARLRFRIGRVLLLAAAGWFAIVAVTNFVSLGQVTVEQMMERLGPLSRGIVAATSMLFYAVACFMSLTRPGAIEE